MSRVRPFARLLATGAALMFAASGARAETLADAISLAYRSNPQLQGARADLRATDEGYVQARAGWGLQAQITFSGEYDKGVQRDLFGNIVEENVGDTTFAVAQPLYTGGRVAAQVTRALRDIDSDRQRLRAVEAEVLFDVVQAYADVRRDQEALTIHETTLQNYLHLVDEVSARLKAGELTKTDVAQAQSQLETERALLNNAKAQLETSRAAYAAVVGQNPGSLAPEAALPGLPATADEAYTAAQDVNPQLLQAIFTEQSNNARVAEARAAFRPNVSLNASYGYHGALKPFDTNGYDRAVVGQITITQPLFNSGQRGSAVRQATARDQSSRAAVDDSRRTVIQNVASAWNAMVTSRDNLESAAAAVTAAEAAVQGMQVEFRADYRSTFDVLNAEERLDSARLFLLSAQHDQYVAAARLIAITGRLEAASLLPDIPTYDPKANFKQVRDKGALPTDKLAELFDNIAPPKGLAYTPLPPVAAPSNAPHLAPAAPPTPANATRTTTLPIDDSAADAALIQQLRKTR